MAADDVFPAEMPDHPSHPTVPLDDDTAERLLAGRLHPEDAPPGYAEVTRLLRAAAASVASKEGPIIGRPRCPARPRTVNRSASAHSVQLIRSG